MKVLVVGSGGREHALAWKLASAEKVDKVFVSPGNGGIPDEDRVPIKPHEIIKLADFAQAKKIDLTVVGPELPLTLGIVDEFEKRGLKIFGPDKLAAELEGSKVFAKEFMRKHNIPTADFEVAHSPEEAKKILSSGKFGYPVVIKADGLAGGKGSLICKTEEDALQAVELLMLKKVFGRAGEKIVIERFLEGKEISFTVISDGYHILPFVTSLDHKRAYDGDKGPNTGGMGAISPCPYVSSQLYREIIDRIIKPTIEGMLEEGRKFRGVLYAGLMVTDEGPKVLEFNVRFGDPETQAMLLRLKSDLTDVLLASIEERVNEVKPEWDKRASAVVVLASGGYPGSYEKGKLIEGLDQVGNDVVVFHAGTERKDGKFYTAGGRVLNIAALGETLNEALDKVYSAIAKIKFEKMHYRKDIGRRT